MKCKWVYYSILLLALDTSSAQSKTPVVSGAKAINVDVCIYGGTAGGVIAAYAVKKCGKSVILIEPGKMLGGMTTGGLGQTDIGNKQAITGLSKDFYKRIGKKYGVSEQWTFEPHVASEVLAEYIKAGMVDVVLQKLVSKVNKSGAVIRSIEVKDPEDPKALPVTVSAKEFIDCTYEGDLMAFSGVSYVTGREDNKQYNETLNGFQLPDYHKQSGFHQFPDNVSPFKIAGDPSSGLLWGISPDKAAATGTGDKKIQTYNLRICLTDSAENRLPITRPPDYDLTKYELLVRLFAAEPGMTKINDYFIWSLMPNRKTDINNRGAFSTDMIGMNYDLPEGSFENRKKILLDDISYTKGLLYFMKTDRRVALLVAPVYSQLGIPKGRVYGIWKLYPAVVCGEARRMVGEYML